MSPPPTHALREVALVFLKLGTTAFGGPAAHIAMMEEEVVRRRQWLPREEFVDLLGATNLIPGPNSTELAIHLGYRRAGWPGLVVAGVCFIVPAMLLTLGLGLVYAAHGTLPDVVAVLRGIKPVILAVVVQALVGLVKSAVKDRMLGVVAAVCVVLSLLQLDELAILVGAGVLVALARRGRGVVGLLPIFPIVASSQVAAVDASGLFLFFLRVGSMLYGSGYVLLSFLRTGLVERLHWMTETQLLDAVAVGQFTPGPVFTTATFVGTILAGPAGGLAATVGIFLPAFVFVALSGPFIPRIRASAELGHVLDGVNAASLGLMGAVTLQLAQAAVVDVPAALECLVAAAVLLKWKVNSAWLVLLGGALGWLLASV